MLILGDVVIIVGDISGSVVAPSGIVFAFIPVILYSRTSRSVISVILTAPSSDFKSGCSENKSCMILVGAIGGTSTLI